MRTFWITLAGGLFLIAGFNYWADPAHRWHRLTLDLTATWGADQCLLTPNEMDDHRFRLRHIDLVERPDVLFLGSSRVMAASAEALGPGVKGFNAGVPAATVKDYIMLWEKVIRTKGAPRYLVLFVDPWVFNANYHQSSWRVGLSLYYSFLRRTEKTGSPLQSLKLWGALVTDQSNYYWDELRELFSWETLRTSLALLREGRISPTLSLVNRRTAVPKGEACYLADGSRRMNERSFSDGTAEDLRNVAKKYSSGNVFGVYFWKFEPKSLALLNRFLAEVRRAGTKTVVVAPPYHPLVLRTLSEREGYDKVIPDYLSALSRLQNVSVCNVLDPATAGCRETDIIDAMHPGSRCTDRIVRHCARSAGWESELSAFSNILPACAGRDTCKNLLRLTRLFRKQEERELLRHVSVDEGGAVARTANRSIALHVSNAVEGRADTGIVAQERDAIERLAQLRLLPHNGPAVVTVAQ